MAAYKLKIQPAQYYTCQGVQVSTKEFKIMNVPSSIDKDKIEQALRSLCNGRLFYIQNNGIKQRLHQILKQSFS